MRFAEFDVLFGELLREDTPNHHSNLIQERI